MDGLDDLGMVMSSPIALSAVIERLMALDLDAPLTVLWAGQRYQVLSCAAVDGELVHVQVELMDTP